MGYYTAGGFFSHLVHKVSGAAQSVAHAVVSANTRPYAFLLSGGKTTNIRDAAQIALQRATSVAGTGGAGGRFQELFSGITGSPPAGMPSEGTPAFAEHAQMQTYQSDAPASMHALVTQAAHHAGRGRRVRVKRHRGRRR